MIPIPILLIVTSLFFDGIPVLGRIGAVGSDLAAGHSALEFSGLIL